MSRHRKIPQWEMTFSQEPFRLVGETLVEDKPKPPPPPPDERQTDMFTTPHTPTTNERQY